MSTDTTATQSKTSNTVLIIQNDDQYILNHCTKFLARKNTDSRHNFGQYLDGDPRARVCEAWRFPIIDSYIGVNDTDSYAYNKVTFIFQLDAANDSAVPAVIGDFNKLYQPIPLARILFLGEATDYYAVSLRVPKGQAFIAINSFWKERCCLTRSIPRKL